MILVDTNVLSEALRPQPAPEVLGWLSENASVYRVPAVVLAEMWAGVDVLPSGARKNRLLTAVQHIADHATTLDRVMPVTLEIARAFGTVISTRQKKGLSTKPMDALIAATALVHGAAIATRDSNDFSGLGVVLVNPWHSKK